MHEKQITCSSLKSNYKIDDLLTYLNACKEGGATHVNFDIDYKDKYNFLRAIRYKSQEEINNDRIIELEKELSQLKAQKFIKLN